MLPTFTAYPQFAPNQILSSNNLNQLYDYLGEQQRLTRTHLIGIGIVCGLEATLNDDGSQLTISRGCGVTSAGHLIIWNEDEPLEFRRPYTMPEDIDYPFFDLPDQSGNTYPLWELTTDRDDDGEAVALDRDFLTGVNQDTDAGEGDEKVLLLLLECRVRDNSNCTPTSCDDKGQMVETAVRPLLVRRQDLQEIRRVLAADNPGVDAYYSLFQTQAERLGLTTLRSPRFDVTNTQPATTRQLYEAYRSVLSAGFLTRVQTALDAAYASLAPILGAYPANPFAGRVTGMTYLHDGRLFDGPEALGYQYFFDHLVTIIRAYEELRERTEDLFGLCCPDHRIFPRHLVLHHFTDSGLSDELRHVWVSSPVQNRQAEGRRELESLFDRLVALLQPTELPAPGASDGGPGRFTVRRRSEPMNLLSAVAARRLRVPIRITPSLVGRPLSEKAIPYYYEPTDLLGIWNYRLTRRGRATENFGYDAVDWNASDDFVRRPLVYELEPRNFLRIEGIIGQNYRLVLGELRRQIEGFRLPIDLVALRTGDLTGGLAVEDHSLHFSDLEAQYATLRARMLGRLAEVAVRLYDTKILDEKGSAQPATPLAQPRAPLLRRLGTYRYLRGTVGEFYEINYNAHTAASPFTTGLDAIYRLHLAAIHSLVRLEEQFADNLRTLDFTAADTALSTLQTGTRFIGRLAAGLLNDAQAGRATQVPRLDPEEYSDQLDELITAGDLDALRALYGNYTARREEVLRQQLFSQFQEEHPGLRFKAGTEVGGTFIVVYHGSGSRGGGPVRTGNFRLAGRVLLDGEAVVGATIIAKYASFGASTDFDGQFRISVTSLPVELKVSLLGAPSREILVTDEKRFLTIDLDEDEPVDDEPDIPGIQGGMVVADFYLPYRCCGKSAPIHVFPPAAPEEPVEELTAGLEQVSCTKPPMRAGAARATFHLSVAGGTPPYFIDDGNGNTQPVPTEAIELSDGLQFTVADSGGDDVSLTVSTLPVLEIQLTGSPRCTDDNQRFSQDFTVVGGQPPYTFTQPDGSTETVTGSGTVTGIASGEAFVVEVSDSFPEACTAEREVPAHTCTVNEPDCGLPCRGIATRQSYPLWVQRPANATTQYIEVSLEVEQLQLTDAAGNTFSLGPNQLGPVNAEISTALGQQNNTLTRANFVEVTGIIVELINQGAERHINAPLSLEDGEAGLEFSFADNDDFDRLTVESFACFAWALEVNFNYTERIDNRRVSVPRRRRIEYTGESALLISRITVSEEDNTSRAIIPSFDRLRIDRCDPDRPSEPVCDFAVDPVQIRVEGQGRGRQFSIAGAGDGFEPFWEVGFGVPNLSNAASFAAGFLGGDQQATIYLLLVDKERGCFTVATTTIGL